MEPTRNNRRVAHENDAVESSHGHLKKAVLYQPSEGLTLGGFSRRAEFDSMR
jgi:hypothetical protein